MVTAPPPKALPSPVALVRLYGKPSKAYRLNVGGYRFVCATFLARDGFLSECFLLGRTHSHAATRPRPQGPGA